MNPGITFQAIFKRATSTTDGGWDLTLSVSQDEAQKIMQISELRDMLLQTAIIPINLSTEKVEMDLGEITMEGLEDGATA